jgi:hypothetical protein
LLPDFHPSLIGGFGPSTFDPDGGASQVGFVEVLKVFSRDPQLAKQALGSRPDLSSLKQIP